MRKPEPMIVRGYRNLKDADFVLGPKPRCYICGGTPNAYMEVGTVDDETRRTEWQYVMLLCFQCIESWDLREENAKMPAPGVDKEDPEPEETPDFIPQLNWGP